MPDPHAALGEHMEHGFTLRCRLPDRVTCYHITVVNEAGAQGIMAPATLDGVEDCAFPL